MKTTPPNSPIEQAKLMTQPAMKAGVISGQMTRAKICRARGAEVPGGFLDIGCDVLEHRLDRSDYGRDRGEGHGDDDADLGVVHRDPCRDQYRPYQPFSENSVTEVRLGDGGGEREGQVDHSIEQALAEEFVARQHQAIPAGRRRR